MKKINIFLVAALALGAFASCEDAPAPAPIQENPQGPVLSTADFKVTPAAAVSGEIAVNPSTEADTVTFFNLGLSDQVGEGLSPIAAVELCANSDFKKSKVVRIPAFVKGQDIKVAMADFNKAEVDLLTAANHVKTPLYYHVMVGVKQGTADYELGSALDGQVSVVNNDYYATNENKMLNLMGGSEYWGMFTATTPVSFTYAATGKKYGETDGKLAVNGSALALSGGAGLYFFKGNFADMNYTFTHISQVAVIGGGDWNADRNLTPNADYTVWTGTANITDSWKLRMNGSWDINLGGTYDNPVPNGDNFPNEAGECKVTINFSGNHPVITVEKL